MSKVQVALIALFVVLTALAGCLHPEQGLDQDPWGGPQERQDAGDGQTAGNATLSGNITMAATGNETGGDHDDGNETDGGGPDPGNATATGDPVGNATVYLNATAQGSSGNETMGNETRDGGAMGNETSHETTTDASGAYHFDDVAPGEYQLQVVAPCCVVENVTVTLQSGENATLDVTLEPLDTGPDYVLEIHEWEGSIVCGAAGVNACFLAPGSDNVHVFNVDEGLKSLVVAMEWGSGQMSLAFERVHDDGTHVYQSEEGEGPLEMRVDAGEGGAHDFDNIDGSWELRFRVFPQGASPQLNQDFTVHYHMFYGDHAPQGYSALPADAQPDG